MHLVACRSVVRGSLHEHARLHIDGTATSWPGVHHMHKAAHVQAQSGLATLVFVSVAVRGCNIDWLRGAGQV